MNHFPRAKELLTLHCKAESQKEGSRSGVRGLARDHAALVGTLNFFEALRRKKVDGLRRVAFPTQNPRLSFHPPVQHG
jgi:hypothetical protein